MQFDRERAGDSGNSPGMQLVALADECSVSYPVDDCCAPGVGLSDESCFRWAGAILRAFPTDPVGAVAQAYLGGHPRELDVSLASMGLATCSGEGFEEEWRETTRRLATACWLLMEGVALADSGADEAALMHAEGRAWVEAWRRAQAGL